MAAMVLGLLPGAVHARAGVIGTSLHPCILRAGPGMEPGALFAHPERFDCTTAQKAFGPGDYWVLSAPLPPRAGIDASLRIRFASLWQERLTLHTLYDDGRIARENLDQHGLTRAIQLGAIMEVRVPRRAVAARRLLWHVEGAANLRGILIAPTLATATQSALSNADLAALYGAFGGLTLALFVYNLSLWAALRHRFQLVYGAMIVALSIYAFSSSGALAWAWPTIGNNDRIRINYAALAASAILALAFARAFFEPRVFAGWLGRAATVVMAALGASAVAFVLLAPIAIHALDIAYAVAAMSLLLIVVPMLWRAWTMRSNYLWLFAIGWAAPVVFATLRTLGNLGLIEWRFWIDNSTLLSMGVEALVSSAAIAYRIRLLSRERDEAREQEIAARLLADSDPLTGLANRRGFLRDAIGRSGVATLLIVDIDHFKRVNDAIGHDGGDEVLRIVARALRAAAPSGAAVARLGGEEFAVLTDVPARDVAAAILDRVRGERMPFDLAVTVSIGAASGPCASENDWKTLYRAADMALFDAKAAGRDRSRCSTARAA